MVISIVYCMRAQCTHTDDGKHAYHAALPHERHPVFDTVYAVRDLPEVVLSERFLIGVKRAVVGARHL